MVEASELKPGMVVMLEGELHSVVSAGYHAGGGQQGSAVFTKVKNLKSGHVKELRLHPHDKLEEVALDNLEMEYLYTDGVAFHFMNPDTFEQISLPLGNHWRIRKVSSIQYAIPGATLRG